MTPKEPTREDGPVGSRERDSDRRVELVGELLRELGYDPSTEGLKDTPRRFVRFLEEFLHPPAFTLTTFEAASETGMVMQCAIPFFSLCEHHLVPFRGLGAIAYIPRDRIVGLSKLARVLDHFARRLQNQERITNNVANYLEQELRPRGVAVVLNAEHMCMAMRGVAKEGVRTLTETFRGEMREEWRRTAFLDAARRGGGPG